jgi:hypothetical protein
MLMLIIIKAKHFYNFINIKMLLEEDYQKIDWYLSWLFYILMVNSIKYNFNIILKFWIL